MGEFGPSFNPSGGGMAPDSVISFDGPGNAAFDLLVIHIGDAPVANWHLNVEIVNLDDSDFTYPLVYLDTFASQTNWYYIPCSGDMTGSLIEWPQEGVRTSKTDDCTMGALYILSTYDLRHLQAHTKYLMRVRQTADSGKTWTHWRTKLVST